MRKLVEYKIISGNIIETRRTYMTIRNPAEKSRRAPRTAGNTSEQKIKTNERDSARELARRLNANYKSGDCHLVLKYTDERLPRDEEGKPSYEEAEKELARFIRKYRAAYRKATGEDPRVVDITANWNPHKNCPARLHHHIVIEKAGRELAMKIWGEDAVRFEALDNRLDHSDLAAYLVSNVKAGPGKKKWHGTRNLIKPIYTEPVEVDDVEDVRPEKDAVIKEHSVSTDEDGRVISSYLRVAVAQRPKVRDGKIVIPKNKKRGGRAT